jgi:predicted metal-dependent hydrolase
MEYVFKINKKTRGLTLSLRVDGSILVTSKRKISASVLERFITEKSEWIENVRRARAKRAPSILSRVHSKEEVAAYIKQARLFIPDRLAFFNTHYGYTYGRISIRNQKTRWGSCSRAGALSFNYRLACIPARLADYVIVHELCHRKEMNHSTRFWKLVSETIPDHRTRRTELRNL